ncbi:sn-glycerol-3-phosphate import ATP-binding protein UgpC [Moorella thermoacetica]|uniref:sn-glycerol-3-phosphate import ATP-binding protein UgpC n=1 Tax=Neomoorella thermoacetica TaxID=1525 RepID=A0A1J5JX34_NEOTH|nr:ABC transporter ATP-binding protein [Moorella thermoacetica]OIQ08137.1 sn-glycerol-3-phosphate import ATP-binding protein UgpC [Moorella thermoacetica]
MAELELRDLCKTYYKNRQPVEAVKHFNLTCNDGEFVALLGPSGCGKSTTLRMIAGLESITSGQILIGGRVINDLHPKDRGVGLAFENYALYPPLTVYENIAFNLRAKGVKHEEIDRQVKKIAELMRITELLNMKPGSLSGGQKQRVNIARAIVRRADVLLLDEPLSHLDGKMRQQMRTEIKRLHIDFKNTTILVTHDQLEAMALADRIAIMKDGVLQQFGTPLEVYNNPVNEFVAGFIGEPPMNLFTVKVLKGDQGKQFYFEGSDVRFKVPDRYQNLVKEGDSYRLGIRPNDIKVVVGEGQYSLAMKVAVFENLGEERRIMVRINGSPMIVVTQERQHFTPGDEVRLLLEADKIHLFNLIDGMRVK